MRGGGGRGKEVGRTCRWLGCNPCSDPVQFMLDEHEKRDINGECYQSQQRGQKCE